MKTQTRTSGSTSGRIRLVVATAGMSHQIHDIRRVDGFYTFPQITGCGVVAFEEPGARLP